MVKQATAEWQWTGRRAIGAANWGEGHSAKTWQRHGGTQAEGGQVYLNPPGRIGAKGDDETL